MKKYKLMIKTHNITKKKYLCVTMQKNWEKYSGSGIYWKKHLKKHGKDISTKMIYSSDDIIDFSEKCILISNELDIVLNDEFANLIIEDGYYNNNFYNWWLYASEEAKQDVYKRRNNSIKENHWVKGNNSEEIKQKISKSHIEYWNQYDINQRREMTNNIRNRLSQLSKNKNSKWYKSWVSQCSISKKEYYANIDPKIISDRNRKQRLNITPENAKIRKEKIQKVYATGKHDHIFKRYSDERQGFNNPNVKKIKWDGVLYTNKSFKNYIRTTNISINQAYRILDDTSNKRGNKINWPIKKTYPIITCPFCGKKTNGNSPSGFKRWHFNNCRINKEKI